MNCRLPPFYITKHDEVLVSLKERTSCTSFLLCLSIRNQDDAEMYSMSCLLKPTPPKSQPITSFDPLPVAFLLGYLQRSKTLAH